MRVMTHEEMFLDVDRSGQFIPGVQRPDGARKTFRQVFEEKIAKKLDGFTDVKFYRHLYAPKGGLAGMVAESVRDIRSGRDSAMDQAFFSELCGIVSSSLSVTWCDFGSRQLEKGEPIYIGEFPLTYYENKEHTKTDSEGRRYSAEMDVFYMLALDVTGSLQRHLWQPGGQWYLKEIEKKQAYLESIKPGFLAGRKKREYYNREKERADLTIRELKLSYIESDYYIHSDLFQIQLVRLWALNAWHPDAKVDKKNRKALLEALDNHEACLLRKIEEVTRMELELGIKNDTFFPYKSKADVPVRDDDWDDDD